MLHQAEIQVHAAWLAWLQTPAGAYLLAWLQDRLDVMLADEFGYFAVQCGMPNLEGLRNNRMSHRIVLQHPLEDGPGEHPRIWVDSFAALPLASASVDLLLLPHVLEFSPDPHAVLREAQRVLRSEGRLVIAGLNPWSLWGLRELALGSWFESSLPMECRMIALGRLRDWMGLLEFDMDRGRFGCYRPICQTELWLERWAWMESAGDRWWPICGASYVIGAVKRSKGMRWVGLIPGQKRRIFSRAQVARI
ncbi:MAG: class I SAM-dependent methyltransferase [Betaproteobacteria bacterium]|nr:class I SAM-dependent methyltransferase [Betaproteobacteria bacterium]